MPAHDSPDAFYLAFDENPGDTVTTLALADWYEEQGNGNAAACLRWAVSNGRWPFRYRKGGPVRVSSPSWHDGWYWWSLDEPSYGRDWGHPPECRLPRPLWDRLAHSFNYDPAVFKEYASGRAAYEALFAAYRGRRR